MSTLETKYWSAHEDEGRKVLYLRRRELPVDSTDDLRADNHRIIAHLDSRHASWGVVVDLRRAPARSDPDFEKAMKHLRHQLVTGFSRISVLVASAVGKLQVGRIDRLDGKDTFVTQEEVEATRHASGR